MNNSHKAAIRYTSVFLSIASIVASLCIYKLTDITGDVIPVETSTVIDDADYGATDEWTEDDSRVTVFHINLSKEDLYEAMYEDIAPQGATYEYLEQGTFYTTVPITVGKDFSDFEESSYIQTEEDNDTTRQPDESVEDTTTVSETVTSQPETSASSTTSTSLVTTSSRPVVTTTTATQVTREPRDWESSHGDGLTQTPGSIVETTIIDVQPVTTTEKTTTTSIGKTVIAVPVTTTTEKVTRVDITTTQTKATTTTTTTVATTTHESKPPFINNDGPGDYVDDDEIYRKMLTLLNNARAEKGLDPLWYSARVHEVAALRATECSYYYSHQRPDGSKFSTAFKDAGIKYSYCGENIAYGRNMFKTVEEVFQAWMDSPSHYENIMNPRFECVAFGLNKLVVGRDVYYYWAQEFCTFNE